MKGKGDRGKGGQGLPYGTSAGQRYGSVGSSACCEVEVAGYNFARLM